jgi:hypothetical protein
MPFANQIQSSHGGGVRGAVEAQIHQRHCCMCLHVGLEPLDAAVPDFGGVPFGDPVYEEYELAVEVRPFAVRGPRNVVGVECLLRCGVPMKVNNKGNGVKRFHSGFETHFAPSTLKAWHGMVHTGDGTCRCWLQNTSQIRTFSTILKQGREVIIALSAGAAPATLRTWSGNMCAPSRGLAKRPGPSAMLRSGHERGAALAAW